MPLCRHPLVASERMSRIRNAFVVGEATDAGVKRMSLKVFQHLCVGTMNDTVTSTAHQFFRGSQTTQTCRQHGSIWISFHRLRQPNRQTSCWRPHSDELSARGADPLEPRRLSPAELQRNGKECVARNVLHCVRTCPRAPENINDRQRWS